MDLSVVVPLYNERENVAELYRELTAVLRGENLDYEILFVDDGSDDGSGAAIEGAAGDDPRTIAIRLSRNYGQTAAIAAGIAHSRGDDVVLMDGDRQNDPRDLPAMLARRREGYDLVAGWRHQRRDPWLSRRLPSRLANTLIGWITGVRLHDYGCTLKLLRGDTARSLQLYGEMHRFIPALVDDVGGRIVEVKVNHRPRIAGRSKYGLSRTVRVLLDLVTVKFLSTYSTRPIHVFGVVGLASVLVGAVILGWLAVEKVYLGNDIGDRPLVLLGILLSITGFQFITMGLLGELLVRTYHESQGKPVYRIESVHRNDTPRVVESGGRTKL
jgi:glycosyltransferase involved in cell wall biosynthesis